MRLSLKHYANMDGMCHSSYEVFDPITNDVNFPFFTDCFAASFLVWIPAIFTLCIGAICFYWVYKYQRILSVTVPWQFLNIAKLSVLAAAALLQLCALFYRAAQSSSESVPAVFYIQHVLLFFSMIMLCAFTVFSQRRAMHTSGFMFWATALHFLCSIPAFYMACYVLHNLGSAYSDRAFDIIFCMLMLIELLLQCMADKLKATDVSEKSIKKINPERYMSFANSVVYNWFNGIAWRAWRNAITQDDLYELHPKDTSAFRYKKWKKAWKYERHKHGKHSIYYSQHPSKVHPVGNSLSAPEFGRQSSINSHLDDTVGATMPSITMPSVINALLRCHRRTIIKYVLLYVVIDALEMTNPFVLRALIGFVGSDDPTWIGISWCLVLFAVSALRSALIQYNTANSYRMGMQVRSELTASVFEKSLRLSNSARSRSTVGEIVNLMSIDVLKMMEACYYVFQLFTIPIKVTVVMFFLHMVVCFVLLWQELGAACLAGVTFLLLLIPLNICIGSLRKNFQAQQLKNKDQRIKMMSEILSGMKVLKLYAWEEPFEERILNLRSLELRHLRNYLLAGCVVSFVFLCAPFMIAASSFATFVLISASNVLTPQIAFVSITLMNILKVPTLLLPMIITQAIQAFVSARRLSEFLDADELDLTAIMHGKEDKAIRIIDGSFAWGSPEHSIKSQHKISMGSTNPRLAKQNAILNDVQFKANPGELTAIVGSVGSGKSSLLQAMLGEMDKLSGSIIVGQAWIQNMTLRDNILFGKDYEATRYYDVLKMCALMEDMKTLANKDMTMIGENGINLSGGQKQRVSIARAVYQDHDIYLFDDPLSAVDSHTARTLFDNVFGPNGCLKNKTRVLVTNALSFLDQTDAIYFLQDGVIVENGSYDELSRRDGGALAELLKSRQVIANKVDEEGTGM